MSTGQIENTEMVDLEFTRGIRKKFVEHLMPDGGFPDSEENRKLLLSTLNDMDKASLSKMKIKSDNALAKAQQATAQIMTNLLTSMSNQRKEAIEGNYRPVTDVTEELDIVVPGETDIGTFPVSIEKLISDQD